MWPDRVSNPLLYVRRAHLSCYGCQVMANPVNSVDPHQMPHYVLSDLGLQCLLMTLVGVSR